MGPASAPPAAAAGSRDRPVAHSPARTAAPEYTSSYIMTWLAQRTSFCTSWCSRRITWPPRGSLASTDSSTWIRQQLYNDMACPKDQLLHLLMQPPDHVTATWFTRQYGQQHLNKSINSYIMTWLAHGTSFCTSCCSRRITWPPRGSLASTDSST